MLWDSSVGVAVKVKEAVTDGVSRGEEGIVSVRSGTVSREVDSGPRHELPLLPLCLWRCAGQTWTGLAGQNTGCGNRMDSKLGN